MYWRGQNRKQVHAQKSVVFTLVGKAVCLPYGMSTSEPCYTRGQNSLGKSGGRSDCAAESNFYMTDVYDWPKFLGHTAWSHVESWKKSEPYANAFIKNLAITEHELLKYLTEIKLISLSNLWMGL